MWVSLRGDQKDKGGLPLDYGGLLKPAGHSEA